MLRAPQAILGDNAERLEQFVVILGDVCCKKQSDPETIEKFSVVIADLSQGERGG